MRRIDGRAHETAASWWSSGRRRYGSKHRCTAWPPEGLSRICDATGGPRGGLLHIGAYPGISARSGAPFLLIECSDVAKSPLTRALEIVDIEAARYGGSVGETVLLSHIPLDALLGTLAARMPLPATPSQIIETHITRPQR